MCVTIDLTHWRDGPVGTEAWLTKRELAAHLHCSTRTIERLAPPAMRVGGQNRYRLSEVESHLCGLKRRGQLIPLPAGKGKESAA